MRQQIGIGIRRVHIDKECVPVGIIRMQQLGLAVKKTAATEIDPAFTHLPGGAGAG